MKAFLEWLTLVGITTLLMCFTGFLIYLANDVAGIHPPLSVLVGAAGFVVTVFAVGIAVDRLGP